MATRTITLTSVKSPAGKKKRKTDMVRRPATARFKKIQAYKTKRPGGKPVVYKDANGVEKKRPRRYKGITQLKRRHKFYTTNKKGQVGSTVVQARVNTFVRQQVQRIAENIAETGVLWGNERNADGKLNVHFQCTDEFNNVMGVHMASLHDAIYQDASERARKTEDQYRGQEPIQVHAWHVEAAWKLRLRVATSGRRSRSKSISVDIEMPDTGRVDEDGNPILSRARYLSTEEQRKAIKGVYNIGRAKPDVKDAIDAIVKQQASEAIRLAMIHRYNQPNNVQLTFDDAKRAVAVLGTFPQSIVGM